MIYDVITCLALGLCGPQIRTGQTWQNIASGMTDRKDCCKVRPLRNRVARLLPFKVVLLLRNRGASERTHAIYFLGTKTHKINISKCEKID